MGRSKPSTEGLERDDRSYGKKTELSFRGFLNGVLGFHKEEPVVGRGSFRSLAGIEHHAKRNAPGLMGWGWSPSSNSAGLPCTRPFTSSGSAHPGQSEPVGPSPQAKAQLSRGTDRGLES